MSGHEQSCEYAGREDLETRYLAGRLSQQEAEAFEAHYFACDACWRRVQRGVELRTAFAGAARAPAPAADVPASRLPAAVNWRSNWWPLAAGVAVAALLLGTLQMTSEDEARFDDVMRGPGDSLPVSARAEAGALVASWSPVPKVDLYRVRLFTAEGALLLERETRDNALKLQNDALPGAQPGQVVYWSVEALDELREPVAQSGLIESPPIEIR